MNITEIFYIVGYPENLRIKIFEDDGEYVFCKICSFGPGHIRGRTHYVEFVSKSFPRERELFGWLRVELGEAISRFKASVNEERTILRNQDIPIIIEVLRRKREFSDSDLSEAKTAK